MMYAIEGMKWLLWGGGLTIRQIFLFGAWLVGIMFTVSSILVATYGKADRNIWNIPPTKCMLKARNPWAQGNH